MEFNLIASEVLESAISFMRHENALLFQKSKKSVWLQKLHIQNQNKDAVLQVICDTAYGYIKKAIDTVSHLVSCLGMFSWKAKEDVYIFLLLQPIESASCIFHLAKYCDRMLRSNAGDNAKAV